MKKYELKIVRKAAFYVRPKKNYTFGPKKYTFEPRKSFRLGQKITFDPK